MLIALSIMLLGGGSNDIWLFPEYFSDQVEEVIQEEKRQSEILDLFNQINENLKSHNNDMIDLAKKISLLNQNPDTPENEFKKVLQNTLQKRKNLQAEILDARLKMTDEINLNEWEQIFSANL